MVNTKKLIALFLFVYTPVYSYFFPNVYPRLKLEPKFSSNAGDPLFLTPYLEKYKIELAQNLSKVTLTEKIGFRSYAGFFTVDKKFNSNLYFWYFPPFNNKADAPVLLWLQGGPGGSSLFGLFAELGPLIVKKDGFALRKYHWALNNHLIFIDNPVGTGFSFTNSNEGFCNNESCIAKNLYCSLQQFFTLFPNLRQNQFFITGESYAGKYIPSLAIEIHKRNKKGNKLINLSGLAIGNGYCDPINQLNYGNYLYQHGLLDDNQLAVFTKYESQIYSDIKAGDFIGADLLLDKLMDGVLSNTSFFRMFTGFDNYYNFLEPTNKDDTNIFMKLLNNDKIRKSVHVGGLPFNDGKDVALHLAYDMMSSVAPTIASLLSHYRIMFYNGQLDIVVPYPLTVNFLRKLEFSSANEYTKAPRKIWRVDGDIAGYVKTAGNLSEVLVRNAGHMVPKDQPKWAYHLINKFITNTL